MVRALRTFKLLLIFSAMGSFAVADDERLRALVEHWIEHEYQAIVELYPDLITKSELPLPKVPKYLRSTTAGPLQPPTDSVRRERLTQLILERLKSSKGPADKVVPFEKWFPGTTTEINKKGEPVTVVEVGGAALRREFGTDPQDIFSGVYKKLVKRSRSSPYQFVYAWDAYAQHHDYAAAHGPAIRASKLFMTTQFAKFLEMDPPVADAFRLYRKLPVTDPFYDPFREALAVAMHKKASSESGTQQDAMNWQFFRYSFAHGLNLEKIGIPTSSLSADFDSFARRYYDGDLAEAVATWLIKSPETLPASRDGGRFNDRSDQQAYQEYKGMLDKVLQVTLAEKKIPLEDFLRTFFRKAQRDLPSVPKEFGPSLPVARLSRPFEEAMDRFHGWRQVGEKIVRELNEQANPPKPKRRSRRGDGGCPFDGLSGL